MLGPRSIAGLVFDEFIVDDAVTRQHSQNLTVALALRNRSPIGCLGEATSLLVSG
jgi:hypothetical protein